MAALALASCAGSERRVESVAAISGRWRLSHEGCEGELQPRTQPDATLVISHGSATFTAEWSCTHRVSRVPLRPDDSGLLLDLRRGEHHCTPAECALQYGVVGGSAKLPSGCAVEDELPPLYRVTMADDGQTLVLRYEGSEDCAMFFRKQ